jgi:hypothetical protein
MIEATNQEESNNELTRKVNSEADQIINELENETDFSSCSLEVHNAVVAVIKTTALAAYFEERKEESVVMDKAWADASETLDKLVEKTPNNAFEAAIIISLIPAQLNNGELDETKRWVCQPGLTLLGTNDFQEKFEDYLGNGEKTDILTKFLIENINIDWKPLDNYDAFYDPKAFLAVQSAYMGLGLKNATNENAKKIYEVANEKLKLPEAKVAAEVLSKVPGCEYITDRIF